MDTNKNKKIAIYCRKSRFTGKGESIDVQKRICMDKIRKIYPDADDEDIIVFQDEGYSGKNTNREEYQEMLEMCRQEELKCIVCYKLDRLSRNTSDFFELSNLISEKNISLVSCTENFDESTAQGRAMKVIASLFSQMEREMISERISDNMKNLAKDGRWLGGNTPTGYKSVKTVGSISSDGRNRYAYMLEIIDEEAEIVKLIFEKFLEQKSLCQVEYYLNHVEKVHSKRQHNFSATTIKAILRNPVYMIADENARKYFEESGCSIYADSERFNRINGMMVYNKTKQQTGKMNSFKDAKEWIVSVGKHKGIIESSNWIKVQKILEENKSKSYRRPNSHISLCSGILYCGDCGSRMRPKITSRNSETGEVSFSYLCELKEKSKREKCKMKRPNGKELDKKVCDEIKKLSEDNSEFMKNMKNGIGSFKDNTKKYRDEITKAENKLGELEKRIKNLTCSISQTDNAIVRQIIIESLEETTIQIEDLKQKINENQQLISKENMSAEHFEKLSDSIKTLAGLIDNMDFEEKKMFLRTIIHKIIWDGENVKIYLFGSDDEEVSEPNREYRK